MNTSPRALRIALLASACGAIVPCAGLAVPPKNPRGNGTAHRAAPTAPAPVVPVQIAGLRAGAGRSWAAVLHALQRDAMPALGRCYEDLASPRGMVHVELSPREDGRWAPASVSAARRNAALEACVRGAVARVAVPPSEADTEDPVVFDLAFGMPLLGRR